jgi:asparagine synthetase B (glutamine-hydrolysing)
MCGIAGAYLRDPSFSVDLDGLLDTMLDEIEHRGGDATGYLALDSEGVAEWHRAACDVPDFVKYRRPVPKGTRTILAHTRYATQGLPAFIENNHPIRRGSFYVIHNGHVSNDQQLFKLSGRERFGQVDSEAIPARISSLGDLDHTEAVMEEIEGAAAIAAVDSKNPADLVLAKGHSSPLFVLVTNKIVLWGSTKATVEKAYKKHVGRLPRKRQIESLWPGDLVRFRDGKQIRSRFKPYKPVYVSTTWQPSAASSAWKENETGDAEGVSCTLPVSSTRHLPTVGGWPKWDDDKLVEGEDPEDYLRCELCSGYVHWSEAQYDWDDNEAVSLPFCPECWDSLVGDQVSDDPAAVNQAILDAGDED